MDSTKVLGQLDSLIDDLLNDSDLPASSLASMLVAARDSVKDGYHFALARRVCDASNAIRDHYSSDLCAMGSSFGVHESEWAGVFPPGFAGPWLRGVVVAQRFVWILKKIDSGWSLCRSIPW
jgi:hypothetical protein